MQGVEDRKHGKRIVGLDHGSPPWITTVDHGWRPACTAWLVLVLWLAWLAYCGWQHSRILALQPVELAQDGTNRSSVLVPNVLE